MKKTLQSTLANAREQLAGTSESARLDAEVLLTEVLRISRASLYANPDQVLSDEQADAFAHLVAERQTGKPVAYLTGNKDFWSVDLRITPDVLVPRPETELLVERALEFIPARDDCKLLDLGCGSGAIAIAIAMERAACSVTATDVSTAALEVAQDNAACHCPERIEFVCGDWFAPLAGRRYDLIVSNPPYVATGQLQLTDPELRHEPSRALYSGADGLDDMRLLIRQAPDHLLPGGHLLLEHGFDQSDTIAVLMAQAGFTNICMHRDLAGQPRVTTGQFG